MHIRHNVEKGKGNTWRKVNTRWNVSNISNVLSTIFNGESMWKLCCTRGNIRIHANWKCYKVKFFINLAANQYTFVHFFLSKNSVRGIIDPTILEPESLNGTLYSKYIEDGIDWTAEKRMDYQNMIRYGKQQSYCIPFTTNDHFMKVQYPKVKKEYKVPNTCLTPQ